MRNRKPWLLAVLFCLGLSLTTAAQRTSDVPVTSTIRDDVDVTDGAGTMQRLPMQIGGDGQGAYRSTRYVQSVIQSIGDWELDAYNSRSADRQVYLNFSQPVAGSGPDGGSPVAPFTSAVLKARLISKCHEYGNSMFSIAGGQTVMCPLIVRFDYGGSAYRIHMNPLAGFYVYPGTNYVNITCTGVDAGSQCNQWKLEPSGDCVTADCAVRKNVGKLVKLVTRKGTTTEVDQGDFYFSFSILVTNP